MLSRVAESIFWMQRYRERAENIARLIDVNLYLSIDAPGDDWQQWHPLVITTGDESLFRQLYGEKGTQKNVLDFLTFEETNPNSILNCLFRSRENARSVREAITSDMWHEINTIYLFIRKASSARPTAKGLFDFYARIRRSCQLFTGIMDTTMSHNEAWHFGRIGNLMERADQSSRILDVKYYMLLPSPDYVGTPYDDILWGAVLKSVSGLETYRKIWHQIHHSHVINFIILNREFPRSIHSCLWRTQQSLAAIDPENQSPEPLALVRALCTEFQTMTVYEIIKIGLHEYLDRIQAKIIEISDSIRRNYFAPLPQKTSTASGAAVTAQINQIVE